LQAVARNIWLFAVTWDINLIVEHILGKDNVVADLLSCWPLCGNPVAKLYTPLNATPLWWQVRANDLLLDWLI
jgi:hypothetical protein